MHHIRSIRRVALGAAIAGAAIGAVPALASAASTCSYNGNTKEVSVTDDSGVLPLRLFRSSDTFIAISDGIGRPPTFCAGSTDVARVTNTNQINIFGPIAASFDGYRIDLSGGPFTNHELTPESDGNSEVEITAFTDGGVPATLTVDGGPGPDTMRAGRNGVVDLGNDSDTDVDIRIAGGANTVRLLGAGGRDFLAGQNIFLGEADVPLVLNGGEQADELRGGDARDTIDGLEGDDVLYASDKSAGDSLSGGPGFDRATVNANDTFVEIEEPTSTVLGRLRLAPASLKAEAGETARLEMSWKHPKAWRELRKVKLTAYRGTKAVAVVDARPGRGSLSSTGAVELMPGSKLGHHGKWVTAKLAMRLPKSLAGENLRVDVQATDKQGHKQLERDAGAIRVAN